MTTYLTQGQSGKLSAFADQILDEDLPGFVADCEAGGATIERGAHAGRQSIKATFGDMVAFIAIGCKSQGDFYRAAKAAGVI